MSMAATRRWPGATARPASRTRELLQPLVNSRRPQIADLTRIYVGAFATVVAADGSWSRVGHGLPRKMDRDRRPLSHDAFGANRPAVRFDQMAHDREAETG